MANSRKLTECYSAIENITELNYKLDEIERHGDLLPKSNLQETIIIYGMNGIKWLTFLNRGIQI